MTLDDPVMTSQEDIQKTFLDCECGAISKVWKARARTDTHRVMVDRNARNGFEGAATWKSEIGNR